jgi:ribose-phosphate pyrophosphokinase
MAIQIIARNKRGFLGDSHARQMHFPAGEAHLADTEDLVEVPEMAYIQGCDPDDLIMLAMASNYALTKGNGLTALMPYLPGARADRGTPFGAKVYADLINSMKLSQVVAFDPHSHIIEGLIKKLTILDTAEVLSRTILNGDIDYAGIISPDAGSRERSGRIAKTVGLPLIEASKHRDFVTGKLSGFSCEPLPDPKGRYLVVDDICDGGGTFLGLAKVIGLQPEQLDLWVSHGVFSKNSENLKTAYGKVFTTDSHPGHSNPDVNAEVVELLPFLLEAAQ